MLPKELESQQNEQLSSPAPFMPRKSMIDKIHTSILSVSYYNNSPESQPNILLETLSLQIQ